jgi:hypothetical protein
LDEDEWEDEGRLLERVATLLAAENAAAWSAAAARAKAAPQPALSAMAQASMGVWQEALACAPERAPGQPIATWRCLRALHYVPWTLPVQARALAPAPAKPNGALLVVARAALALRHTPPGRLLHRLAPRSLVDALKQRL